MSSSRMTHLSLAILACLEPLSHRTLCSPTIIPPPRQCQCASIFMADPCHRPILLVIPIIVSSHLLSISLACSLARSCSPSLLDTRPSCLLCVCGHSDILTLLLLSVLSFLWFKGAFHLSYISIDRIPCAGLAILNNVLTLVSALARRGVVWCGDWNRESNERATHK